MRYAAVRVHTCLSYALLLGNFFFVDCSTLDRSKRENANGGYRFQEPSESDIEKLSKLYGRDMVNSHKEDFAYVGDLGEHQPPIFHPRPPPIDMGESEYRYGGDRVVENVHPQPNHPLTPVMVKRLLRELLERLDSQEGSGRNMEDGGGMQRSAPGGRCSLHGVWISAITGVAFQLEPGHADATHSNVLHVQVVDAGTGPHVAPEAQLINSEWTGTAQVSTESATTISIILQERIRDTELEPKTAVFAGQCVVCSGSPTIQGTWVLFPKNQICFQEARPPQSDVMYLLAR